MQSLYLCFFALLILAGCREGISTTPVNEEKNTQIIVDSSPSRAIIYLNYIYTGKQTPDTLKSLSPGDYSLTLSLYGYRDTTVFLSIDESRIGYLNVVFTRRE